MRQDEHSAARSRSFGEIADAYDRYRPGPPDEAVEWLLPPDAADVLEIGAGTGGLTRHLVARLPHVQAVEPDDRMRAVLADRVPGAEVRAGRAEEIPAADASFDAVFVASAWHWVDEARALPEVARVLRPGGRLALLWSGPDRSVEWVPALFTGGRTLSPEEAEDGVARRRHRHTVELGDDSPFAEPERRIVEWATPMTRDDLVGLVGTYSIAITMDPGQRQRYVADVARYVDSEVGLDSGGAVAMPMRCLCWRASLR